jgi:hypothetical protein
MPRMAAVVRVEFELKQGQSEDAATTALNGGIGALKLAIERGITGNAQTGVVQGSVQASIVEQSLTLNGGQGSRRKKHGAIAPAVTGRSVH